MSTASFDANGERGAGASTNTSKSDWQLALEQSSPEANLFVNYIPSKTTERDLVELFSPFGAILHHKIICAQNGSSLGYGFVQYENATSAQSAMKKLDGYALHDKHLRISIARPANKEISRANIYLSCFPFSWTVNDLEEICAPFGTIIETRLLRDRQSQQSRGIAFVRFDLHTSASAAVQALNGVQISTLLGTTLKSSTTATASVVHPVSSTVGSTGDEQDGIAGNTNDGNVSNETKGSLASLRLHAKLADVPASFGNSAPNTINNSNNNNHNNNTTTHNNNNNNTNNNRRFHHNNNNTNANSSQNQTPNQNQHNQQHPRRPYNNNNNNNNTNNRNPRHNSTRQHPHDNNNHHHHHHRHVDGQFPSSADQQQSQQQQQPLDHQQQQQQQQHQQHDPNHLAPVGFYTDAKGALIPATVIPAHGQAIQSALIGAGLRQQTVPAPGLPYTAFVQPSQFMAPMAPYHQPELYVRLFVGGFPSEFQQDALYHLFASFGPVLDVRIVRPPRPNGSPNAPNSPNTTTTSPNPTTNPNATNKTQQVPFAFVTLASLPAAKNAIASLRGLVMGNRQLRVDFCKSTGFNNQSESAYHHHHHQHYHPHHQHHSQQPQQQQHHQQQQQQSQQQEQSEQDQPEQEQSQTEQPQQQQQQVDESAPVPAQVTSESVESTKAQ